MRTITVDESDHLLLVPYESRCSVGWRCSGGDDNTARSITAWNGGRRWSVG